MKELNFKLSVNEANAILQALGNLPFVQVYPLIQKLQQQAAEQMEGNLEAPTASAKPEATKETAAPIANGEQVMAE